MSDSSVNITPFKIAEMVGKKWQWIQALLESHEESTFRLVQKGNHLDMLFENFGKADTICSITIARTDTMQSTVDKLVRALFA